MGLSLSAFQVTGSGGAPCTVTITVPVGAAVGVEVVVSQGDGNFYHQGTLTDSGGNIYTAIGGSVGGSAFTADPFYCINTSSSATTVTYTVSASYVTVFSINLNVWVWTVSGGTATIGTQSNNYQTSPGTATDAVTSGSVTCAAGSVVMGICYDSTAATDLTVGTGFTLDATGGQVIAEHGAFSSSHAATWTSSLGTENTMSMAISFGLAAAPAVYDGTTASGTVVSTGTGGTALPAFTVGQCIHVLMMAQTASALTETGPSDGHNTYVHLETADNHGTHGFIWDRWMTMVTVPITTPVITTTWSGTAKLAIAVGILTNINTGAPNVVGGNAQQFQTAPSGSNAQSSGLTTSPNLLVPVTLAGWGFSINETAAPAAGSGFSLIGTAWSALGGACLTYETMNSTAAAQQQATFTPVAGNAYTFMDMFYQIGSAPPTVPPSGPMPRQIYVMP